MAYTRTFAQLSLAVQQLGEWERSEDVTPGVLLQAINYGLLEGYDHMVAKWADYFTAATEFALTPGLLSYGLEDLTDGLFYKLRHLEFTRDVGLSSGSRFVRMMPFDLESSWSFRQTNTNSVPRYRIQSGSLVLSSTAVGSIRMFYIPLPAQFTDADDDTPVRFDVPIEERLVVSLAVRDIRYREELDTSSIDRTIERCVSLLRTAADSYDASHPFYLDPRGPSRWDHDDEDDC